MKRMYAAAIGAAVVGLATSAVAADLPAQTYRAPPVVSAPYFSWTGLYAGLNGGYGMGKTTDAFGNRTDMKGAIAGGQVGWQLQQEMFVGGFEGDFQASWQSYTYAGTFNGVPGTADEEVPWFGTIRARAGLAFDRALIYATGGAAYTNFNITLTTPLNALSTTTHGSRVGWTAGGGLEYMFAERWSVKAEYLYIDTGTATIAGTLISANLRNQIVRGGINVHF